MRASVSVCEGRNRTDFCHGLLNPRCGSPRPEPAPGRVISNSEMSLKAGR